MVLYAAAPASAASFTNADRIVIGPRSNGEVQARAVPYPSNITVSGQSGVVTDVNLTLNGLDCSNPRANTEFVEDLDILLVGPTGANVVVVSDVGGNNNASFQFAAIDVTLDDEAAQPLPADSLLSGGTYRPTDDDDDPDETSLIDSFFPPAPTLSGAIALSTFDGSDPNGTWSLYVVDDYSGRPFDGGENCEINGGWTLAISGAVGSPGAPTGVTATAGNGQATVTWVAPASNGGSPITGYTVTAAPGGQTCSTTGALSCTVTGLTNGTSYTFTVVATNSVGAGSASAASSPVVPVGSPGAPTGVTATAGNGQATVTWVAPASNGGSPITGYTVTAAPGGQTCSTTGALSCTVTGLTNGTSYTFTVVATNSVGSSGASAPSASTVPVAVPGAPSGVMAVGGDRMATVSWVAPVSTGGASITGYTVTAAPGGQTCSTNGAVSCTVAGLTNGVSYTFTVAATNSAGSGAASAASNPVVPLAPYRLVASDGGIFSFGGAEFFGSTGGTALVSPVVGMAETASKDGYWLVASDGGIFSFGDAVFKGSTGATVLAKPIVGMERTASGNGYWLVASDGGIFSFGDAVFKGSTGGSALAKPIVGMERTASGNGYWLVASDGGIFSFGDATFSGSTGGITLDKPIVGMARTTSGNGYWLVASDGGIFSFGDATFSGSTGGTPLARPIVGMTA